MRLARNVHRAEHTCAIDESQSTGAVWCWGRVADGALGVEDANDRLTPARTSMNDALTPSAAGPL